MSKIYQVKPHEPEEELLSATIYRRMQWPNKIGMCVP